MATTTKKANQNYSAKLADGRTVTVKNGVKTYSTPTATKKTAPTTTKSTPTTVKTTTPTPSAPVSTYKGNSVVDYIKSTGGNSSFTSRAQEAVRLGIVSNANQYRGTAEQNTLLLQKLQGGAKTSPSAVVDQNTADSFINGGQAEDFTQANQADEPPKRSSASEDLLKNFYQATGQTSLVPDMNFDTPDFTQLYENKRKELGVSGLEESINEYDAMEQEIQARLRERIDTEEGKTVAMNVISGRVGEAEKQEFRRLDEIGRAKNRAINQLQNANSTIETLMNLTKMDYEVAKGEYDTKFNQNLQLFNVFKGLSDLDVAAEDREIDYARSNLQIMYGAIKDGGLDINALEPDMAAKMSSLELKAGLPIGFYKSVAKSNPEGKVLSTTTRTTGGVKYADVIMQNSDGSFSTQQIRLGAESSGSGSSNDDEKEIKSFRADASDLIQKLGNDEIGWGAAFNSLKAKYPQASNELIDATLNKNEYYNKQ